MIFTIRSRTRSGICPKCKRKTTKRKDLKEYMSQSLRHIVLSDKRSLKLKVKRRYWRCDC
jgi:hypothetical protein